MIYCDCYLKSPTVPVFRDIMTHLPDCPEFGSGWPVGADFKWKDSIGRYHIDSANCPCKPQTGRTFKTGVPTLIHQSDDAAGRDGEGKS